MGSALIFNYKSRVNQMRTIKKEDILKMVHEEVDNMVKESQKNTPKIEKKLQELHSKLFKEPIQKESLGDAYPKLEKRIQINLVSEIIEVPVNELMLYFLNNVKTKNERSLVEYHQGQVYFYVI